MELDELRLKINEIDDELLKLFEERMEIAQGVAAYKIDHGMEVFQSDREAEIIKKVRERSPDGLENGSEVLFNTIMDISKSMQYRRFFATDKEISFKPIDFSKIERIACPGTTGSYSEAAARQIAKNAEFNYYTTFEEVFDAVNSGGCEFGILPIQNSTAGSVTQTYELMKQNNFYIVGGTRVRVNHCLAAGKSLSDGEIKRVISHEQGLLQCSKFLKVHGFKTEEFSNTALAARFVKDSNEPIAAICSEECAKDMGLEIIYRGIGNSNENYTRFILISNDIYISSDADIISVSLSLPHSRSALYRLLTKFSVSGLNLLRLENKPIASKDFDVVFYLDFEGSVASPEVRSLINELSSELSYFKFLGNFKEV